MVFQNSKFLCSVVLNNLSLPSFTGMMPSPETPRMYLAQNLGSWIVETRVWRGESDMTVPSRPSSRTREGKVSIWISTIGA